MNKHLDEIKSFQYTIKCNTTTSITNKISGINTSSVSISTQKKN